MADESLIRRTFTRTRDGNVSCEEVWDADDAGSSRFDETPGPLVRHYTFSLDEYQSIAAALAEYMEAGTIPPEAAARTTFI